MAATKYEIFISDKNGAEVENQEGEFVCLDCGCVVEDETGHYKDECDEAGRNRAEDMAYDQWRGY